MNLAEQIHAAVSKAFPDSEVTIQDMTGGGDHFEVVVVSSVFRSKMRIEQHQMVHTALEFLKDKIHAVKIRTIAS